tara:strand:+ start:574 stop:864 length:291 start_codon:yes stop_codon:yes gene_type:complete
VNNKNFKKIDLAKNLSSKKGFSLLYSKKLIDDLLNTITQNIIKKKLNLKNLGSFRILKKNKRIGRNPKTKEIFTINERKVISFLPSKKITKNLNKY